MPRKGYLKATVKVAALLSISRVLGFARSQTMAAYFGATGDSDAFVVAISVVTLTTSITGPITVAFLPVYSSYKSKGKRQEALRLASSVVSVSCVFMAAASILIFANASRLTRLMAPGFGEDVYLKAVSLTRILVPFMVLPLLASFAKSILNTEDKFSVPAAADVLENFLALGLMVLLAPSLGAEALAVSLGVGFLALFLVQYVWVKQMDEWPKAGVHFNCGVKKVFVLALPVMGGSLVAGGHHLVDKALASRLPEGSLSILNYAERVRGLPVGILIASITTVMMPTLSFLWGRRNFGDFLLGVKKSLTYAGYLCLPAAICLMVMAKPIIRLAFQRGAFTEEAAALTSRALAVFATGVPAGGVLRMINMAFISAQDTKSAVFLSVMSSFANVLLDFLFIGPLGYIGLALAHSLSTYAALFLGLFMFKKRFFNAKKTEGGAIFGGLTASFVKMIVSAFIMGGFSLKALEFSNLRVGTGSFAADALALSALTAASLTVYVATTYILKCQEVGPLFGNFNKK